MDYLLDSVVSGVAGSHSDTASFNFRNSKPEQKWLLTEDGQPEDDEGGGGGGHAASLGEALRTRSQLRVYGAGPGAAKLFI